MEKNKTGKYLKYAIGEIVLVVVGILIALQINNANEKRKTTKIQHDYYRQISVDLDKETENINQRIVYLDSTIKTWKTYNEFIKTPNLEPSQILDELLKVNLAFRYLAFNTNTIQTLESTGDIKLMPEEIRNSLIELKRAQDQLSRVAKGNYGEYLTSHEKMLQLGFLRLRDQIPTVENLEIQNNIPNIILIFEGGVALRNFTDEIIRKALFEMLIDIEKIKDLVSIELNEK